MSARRLSLLVILQLVMVHARTTGSAPGNELQGTSVPVYPRSKPEVAGYLADIRLLYKVYEECSAEEFASCLKKKMVVALDRAGKTSKHLTLMEGVCFIKDPSVQEITPVTEKELESSLPRSLEDRDLTLNQMIFDKIIYFFKSHRLEFKLFDDSGSGIEEGRRRKGLNSLLMVPLLLGGTFIPLAFGALALLAGKALIVSKLALALAAIIGLKKLVGGGGGGESYQVVSVPHHGGGHYKRSLDDPSHDLVYSAHVAQADKLQAT